MLHFRIWASEAQEEALRLTQERMTCLRVYWLSGGLAAFVGSGLASMPAAARPDNRIAFVKALAAQRRLAEVYGVGETVTGDSGPGPGPVFKALLALELLMTAFEDDLVAPCRRHSERGGKLASGTPTSCEGETGRMASRSLRPGCGREEIRVATWRAAAQLRGQFGGARSTVLMLELRVACWCSRKGSGAG